MGSKRSKCRGYRLDSLKLDKTYYTEEGYLIDHPVVTKCGIFEYTNPDGSIRKELRLPQYVFDKKSLASYEGKPIIITHEAGEVDKNNVQKEQIGTILSKGYRDGDKVRCKIVIHNTDALKKCGLKELSLGYSLIQDDTPGTWEGEEYDAIQTEIEINHLALVSDARAGEEARLNIDSRDKQVLKGGPKMAMKKRTTKKAVKYKKRYDGDLTPEELEQAIALYKAHQATNVLDTENEETSMDTEEIVSAVRDNKDRRDSETEQMDAEEIIAEQEADIEALLKVIDELQAVNDMSSTDEDDFSEDEDEDNLTDNEDVTNSDEDDFSEDDFSEDEDDLEADEDELTNNNSSTNTDSIDRLVGKKLRAYLDVCRVADRLHLDGIETMGLSAARKKIIKTVNPKLNLDGRSNAYIKAAYDIAKQNVVMRKKTNDQRKQIMNKKRCDGVNSTSSAVWAREKMIRRMQKEEMLDERTN